MIALTALLLAPAPPSPARPVAMTGEGDGARVSFDREVRPLLSDRCFECHGPDARAREAGLRLDSREGLLGEDGAAGVVVPGAPEESLLVQRITAPDPLDRMPPPGSRHELAADEIELLQRWIEQGAAWEGHWAWTPPRVTDPQLDVDALVEAELAAAGLRPRTPTDLRTLVRRLSWDLTGLPARIEDLRRLESGALGLEGYVDQLLASPHYGERMAQHWLDLVRYADTVGYHGDQEWTVWPYRDWVVRAFNENMPFDRFTVEQLAGDLLPEPTMGQRVAASYNRLNMVTFEGGSQPKEFLLKYAADRVRNYSSIWLGSTVGCAECHDHKFDPYTTADFYSLSAFFADIDEVGVYGNFQGRKVPPEMRVAYADQRARLEELEAALRGTEAAATSWTDELHGARAAWETELVERAQVGSAEELAWIATEQGNGGRTEGAWRWTDAVRHGDLRTREQRGGETVQHFFHGASRRLSVAAGDTLFAWVLIDPEDPPEQLMLQFHRDGTWEHRAWWGADRIPFGPRGQDVPAHRRQGDLPTAGEWVRLEVDPATVGLLEGSAIDGMAFTQFGGRVHWAEAGVETRVGELALSGVPPATLAALLAVGSERTEEGRALLDERFFATTPLLQDARAARDAARATHAAFDGTLPRMIATVSVEPREVRVRPRGNWMDDSGPVVAPAVPAFLPQGDFPTDRRATRLDLARWTVSDANPLAARAFVNRIWRLLFGAGLAPDPQDLGTQGGRPSHPELLDGLALEFVSSGWDVKALVRRLVLTRAYQRSSLVTPELDELDPFNRLLARQGRFRLDAEFVRDGALAASGLLRGAIGGPSVKPYQPEGYWAQLNFPLRRWRADEGEGLHRRSLYTFWCRTFTHPAMLAFDAPSREECVSARNRANTPQQALVLLNDPEFVEAARVLAQDLLGERGTADEVRLERLFERVLTRGPRAAERAVVLELLAAERARYAADLDAARALVGVGRAPRLEGLDPAELAAWTQAARLVLNTGEAVTRS